MPRTKGTAKTGGRTKGTPNKVTRNLRELITQFLDAKFDRLEDDFDQLEPKDRIIMFEKLMKYALPIQTSVELESKTPPQVIRLSNGATIDLS